MDCFIKTAIISGNITITSTHSLRSLGKLHGRISLRSRTAPIKFPVMWGVSNTMIVNNIKYELVVTSVNDFDNLSLECCLNNELLIEADLVSYIDKKANVYVRKCPLEAVVIKAFINELDQELKFGGNPRN
jgi:hypothetical protein